jgi:hypothetical protein
MRSRTLLESHTRGTTVRVRLLKTGSGSGAACSRPSIADRSVAEEAIEGHAVTASCSMSGVDTTGTDTSEAGLDLGRRLAVSTVSARSVRFEPRA